MSTHKNAPSDGPPDQPLLERYGELMTSAEVAAELRYSSPAALNLCRRKGLLRLSSIRIPGHRGDIYKTREVASVLASWLNQFGQGTPM